MVATIIDSLIVVLLIGSIGYGYMVSMKLRHLMATLKELQPLVEEFSSAVDKSEQSVNNMRENIEVAQRKPEPVEEPTPAERQPGAAAFASRRAPTKPDGPERTGVRVVRDKKEMVRAFFENSSAAKG
ncbi:MAG: flagellar motor switch protein [Sulfitobacter sp.]|jgi:hypothetical protein|uniref:flagellar motor switch protein n=1 Tax=Sulfitobacter sp. TaxID=1903071 RepID=UPI000C4F975A|nr:flagellar motor switch protein [Roseobacter sp.]MBV50402.1 flagellar motor switch protein [Roseobacter sp.]|tara:strand:- start:5680 stop:6063 length:384 start_codon:yes stop_codon:yes gene_type:complete